LGTTVKIRLGPFKGYRGPVVEVKGNSVRVELEMKIVTVDRGAISDNVATTPFRDTSRYSMGSETPMHPSRTPLHPYMTPMRDSGATPIHDGMRTPMRDRAWNPYTPMSPPRDNWEDGNPGSWGTSPQYQVRFIHLLFCFQPYYWLNVSDICSRVNYALKSFVLHLFPAGKSSFTGI
jgi:transcription elongation factor SPT5